MRSNKDLPLYNPSRDCIKCGAKDTLREAHCSGFSIIPFNICPIKGEHIHKKCSNCDANYCEQCKDKTIL